MTQRRNDYDVVEFGFAMQIAPSVIDLSKNMFERTWRLKKGNQCTEWSVVVSTRYVVHHRVLVVAYQPQLAAFTVWIGIDVRESSKPVMVGDSQYRFHVLHVDKWDHLNAVAKFGEINPWMIWIGGEDERDTSYLTKRP